MKVIYHTAVFVIFLNRIFLKKTLQQEQPFLGGFLTHMLLTVEDKDRTELRESLEVNDKFR